MHAITFMAWSRSFCIVLWPCIQGFYVILYRNLLAGRLQKGVSIACTDLANVYGFVCQYVAVVGCQPGRSRQPLVLTSIDLK
jgi:hypothetical protein